MAFLFLGQDEQDDVVALALLEREREYHNYELNRLNYAAMLAAMADVPAVWPDGLVRYRGVYAEKLAEMLQGDDYALVTRLQHRDRVRCLLATTTTEQARCRMTYEALLGQIADAGRLEAARTRVGKGD